MITIQIDRVKYKPTPEQQNEFYMKFMEDIGTHKLVLEEVKENEDPVGDTIIKDMLDNAYKVTYAKDHSILEKLRGQIEYWIAEAESCADTPNIYNDYRAGVMREVLATIKSLEQSQTKEEPLGHNHILEALGEDYGMMGDYTLMKIWYGDTVTDIKFHPVTIDSPGRQKIVKLPRDLSDLSLPKYEETRKQLISLLK